MGKRLLLLSLFIIVIINTMSAQNTDTSYSAQWKEINTLINDKDLPKTALEKTNAIYTDAKKKGLQAQQAKALLYRFYLEADISEKNINDNIKNLDEEIANATSHEIKSILLCIKATALNNYLNQNRWKFYQRSNTVNFVKEDVETWSIDDLLTAISQQYTEALKPEAELQQTSLEQYDDLILKGNSRNLRPSLYDLIAHTALDYFKSAESYTTKPEKEFELTPPNALGNIAAFLSENFNSNTDNLSNTFLAIQLFQKLISFHKNDKDPSALIDVNIERIVYAKSNIENDDAEAYYTKALQEITTTYPNNPQTEQAWYMLAQAHADKASGYQPYGDTTSRYEYIEAKKILDARLVKKDTANEGLSNMRNLLASITKPSLSTQVENINIINSSFRMYVQYRNVKTMYVRVLKMDGDEFENRWDDNYWNKIVKVDPYKTFSQTLPDTKDYQQHSVEIKVDGLPSGSYVILASSDSDFPLNKGALVSQNFDVSNISFVNFEEDYFVLDRDKGAPLSGAHILAQWKQWDYNTRRYTVASEENYIADVNGKFNMSKSQKEGSPVLTITYNNDKLKVQAPGYYSPFRYGDMHEVSKDEYEKNSASIYYFTDRSIYRPGQTVYFKGIVTTKNYNTKQPMLFMQGKKVTVRLNDVNYRMIDSLEAEVNEYGSFSGKFILPKNALTGNFTIRVDEAGGSQAMFSVEEYKRPTFYINYDTVKTAYRIGDTIKIIGYAKAYAGNNIDGASVTYSVERNARFIYDWMWWRPYPSSSSKQIANGVIKTDENGKFEISFIAAADTKIDKTTDPVFNFTINAAVTDNRGETREESTTVSVAYKSLTLQLSVPSTAEVKDFKKIGVSVQNMQGIDVNADVNIKIIPLQAPQRLLRSRYWEKPDQFIMDEKTYTSVFPNDIYKDEDDYKTWQQKSEILNAKFETTSTTKDYKLETTNLSAGTYMIEAITHDDDGNEVKDIKYIRVYDASAQTPPFPVYSFHMVTKNDVQPGENASMFIASSAQNIHVIQNNILIPHPEEKQENSFSYFDMKAGKKEIVIPVTEASRNGQALYYAYVINNRFYTGGMQVNIPDSSKDLHISYETWRDKTEPGNKETWKVKISGSGNTKVAAELLTAMYDASLDQFQSHGWNIPALWNKPYINNSFQGNTCFGSLSSQENYYDEGEGKYYEKIYDELITNGDAFINGWSNVYDSNMYTGQPMHRKPQYVETMAVAPALADGASKQEPLRESFQNMTYNYSISGSARKLPGEENAVGDISLNSNKEKGTMPNASPLRKNFNETAFFFPNLYADADGAYTFSFTMPEALTKWKWLSLAHTKDLAFGYDEKNTVTQKQIMVQPSLPRFVRQGDKIDLVTRISNITDKPFAGEASLEIVDAITNQPADAAFANNNANQSFSVSANGNTTVKFPVSIPMDFINPIIIKIKAVVSSPSTEGGQGEAFGDGEENTLPVLTNRLFITESLPLYQRGDGKKEYSFTKLIESDKAAGNLQTQSVTVEYTANPVWYVVQALPYLKDYKYDCAEQIFNSYYANALAHYIVSTQPQIKQVFDLWKSDTTSPLSARRGAGGEALQSNLEKDQELKQLLIEATPWLADAQNETEQKKNIALLFDDNVTDQAMQALLIKLKDLQNPSGAFSWFKGGYDDRYITQYILTGIGKLYSLNAVSQEQKNALQPFIENAMRYLDISIQRDYDQLKQYNIDLSNNNLSYTQMQYLLMRSYFNDMPGRPEAYNYYYSQCKTYWNKQNSYFKAMISLVLYRSIDKNFVKQNILPSILENTVTNTDGALYWKDLQGGYYWYQQPIEQQAFMIEAMNEIANTENDASLKDKVGDMQLWLIRNKQTNNWKTSKATADACYALLAPQPPKGGLEENTSLTSERNVKICLGKKVIVPSNTEAGAGYFKQKIEGSEVKPSMGNIEVQITNSYSIGSGREGASWGAVYWQYFQDMDAVTPAATPLSLSKKLFIERNTSSGKIIDPVTDSNKLSVGDKLIMRIELRSDRDMEYIHLKDMRASTMEPVNVLSSYKWQDGLGYYESTKDVATDFFISYLPKGTYVFEYPVRVTHTGEFSAGIATVQCMYAPEYSSHSEGFRVQVNK